MFNDDPLQVFDKKNIILAHPQNNLVLNVMGPTNKNRRPLYILLFL